MAAPARVIYAAARVVPSFNDGVALGREVVTRGLEGVVGKRIREPYRPGERGWIKKKKSDGPRFEEEREAAIRLRRTPS